MGLRRGAGLCGESGIATVVVGRLFTSQSHGLRHCVISVIYVCFCSEILNDCWLNVIQTLGGEPGKRAAVGLGPVIFQMHNNYQSQKTHVRQFSSTSVKYPSNPLTALNRFSFSGVVFSLGNQYERRFTSGRRRPFKTSTINCCQSEEIFHCLKAL